MRQGREALASDAQVTCHLLDLGSLCELGDPRELADALEGRVMPRYLDRACHARHPGMRAESLGTGLILAGCMGLVRDGDLLDGPYGKPEPTSGDWHLGISHTHQLVAVCSSPSVVGIDVASASEDVDRLKVMTLRRGGQALAPSLEDQPSRLTPEGFARLWTRLEATLKAEGTGFYADLREHQDWFGHWRFRWGLELGHVVCAATAEGLPLELRVHEPEALLGSVRTCACPPVYPPETPMP
ncbi:4'-phosphopantetheinyl transferase family protein [Olsenella phocaeensis]|uniref:4'-phosphopantetheinyl transferase family protein n=1 Tax=Olsenella phocaeensis TaxID=1852385 RepID=UPI003A91DD4A